MFQVESAATLSKFILILFFFQWENVFDPQSGSWLFQSPFGHKVPSDRNDTNFTLNCRRRDKQAVRYLEENIPVEAFPYVQVNECACGVSDIFRVSQRLRRVTDFLHNKKKLTLLTCIVDISSNLVSFTLLKRSSSIG